MFGIQTFFFYSLIYFLNKIEKILGGLINVFRMLLNGRFKRFITDKTQCGSDA